MHSIADLAIPNTLALPSVAQYGCEARSARDVVEARRYAAAHQLKFHAVGEASNLVLQPRVDGFVCLMRNSGIEVLNRSDSRVLIQVAAGHHWHDLVMHTLEEGWYGLENLALIPGSVGASPVQNIGAYGQEVARVIESVTVVDAQGTFREMSNAECDFGYRRSAFQQARGLTIVSVSFSLAIQFEPNWAFPALRDYLMEQLEPGHKPGPMDVAEAVMTIRRQKLPDPAIAPNVGSFFKNPLVSLQQVDALQRRIPDLVTFRRDNQIKLSAAQLIDRAGWKQRPASTVACWRSQPLVLTNTGGATAQDVLSYAAQIQHDVAQRYGVQLEVEPSVLS